jgi:hypothetical protein
VADERVRIEIAFDSGQVMSVQADRAAVDRLEQALASNADGSITLESQEGSYAIALRKVTYVKRFARESRIGFGES